MAAVTSTVAIKSHVWSLSSKFGISYGEKKSSCRQNDVTKLQALTPIF